MGMAFGRATAHEVTVVSDVAAMYKLAAEQARLQQVESRADCRPTFVEEDGDSMTTESCNSKEEACVVAPCSKLAWSRASTEPYSIVSLRGHGPLRWTQSLPEKSTNMSLRSEDPNDEKQPTVEFPTPRTIVSASTTGALGLRVPLRALRRELWASERENRAMEATFVKRLHGFKEKSRSFQNGSINHRIGRSVDDYSNSNDATINQADVRPKLGKKFSKRFAGVLKGVVVASKKLPRFKHRFPSSRFRSMSAAEDGDESPVAECWSHSFTCRSLTHSTNPGALAFLKTSYYTGRWSPVRVAPELNGVVENHPTCIAQLRSTQSCKRDRHHRVVPR